LLRGPIRVPVARAAATAPRPAARGLLFVAGLGRCLRGSALPVSSLCVDSLRLGGLRLSSLLPLRGLVLALLERRLRDGGDSGARLVLLLLRLRIRLRRGLLGLLPALFSPARLATAPRRSAVRGAPGVLLVRAGQHEAASGHVLTGRRERLRQSRADPLARHLTEAQRGDLGDLVA